MAVSVACLTAGNPRSRNIAEAMAEGIKQYGDRAVLLPIQARPTTDAAVCYGWKQNDLLRRYPKFIYADLGYWQRERYYRFAANGWSPRVRMDLPSDRFDRLGLDVKPWRTGSQIVVAGSTAKACRDHGRRYMEWERAACERFAEMGYPVIYRPKPNDPLATEIPGFGCDKRPIGEALKSAHLWVTHHSNSALDAMVAGVPAYCEMGAASALSVTQGFPQGRRALLNGVAYLQWTLDEMRSGEAWAHLRTYLADV